MTSRRIRSRTVPLTHPASFFLTELDLSENNISDGPDLLHTQPLTIPPSLAHHPAYIPNLFSRALRSGAPPRIPRRHATRPRPEWERARGGGRRRARHHLCPPRRCARDCQARLGKVEEESWKSRGRVVEESWKSRGRVVEESRKESDSVCVHLCAQHADAPSSV